MTGAGPIVVGLDGSPASLDAVRWALTQAELTRRGLRVVTSWQTPSQYGMEFYGETFNWVEIAQQTADAALAEVAYTGPVEVERVVAEGHPAQVLVEASAGAPLLVVGSRGHDGFAGLLLGSVSEHVIAHAHCPVLVVRDQHTPPPAS